MSVRILKLIPLLILLFSNAFAQRLAKTPPRTIKTPLRITFEKAYLHTDREYYWAGENIWFKAYLINGQSNQLAGSSNALTVELINNQSEIVLKEQIYIKNGVGKGDFKLAADMPPGLYSIKAYTTFMSYFGDNLLFEKPIYINTPQGTSQGVAITIPKVAGSNQLSPAKQSSSANANQNIINFFPESGSMVEDVSGTIAFKAEQVNQAGIRVWGKIISSSGEIVGSFESDSSGLGSLSLRPLAGMKYFARGQFGNGQLFETPLPSSLLQGFTIHSENLDSALAITVSTNQATLQTNKDKEFNLLFKSRGKIALTKKIIWDDMQSAFILNKRDLPTGISEISLYDLSGKPYCERLVYIGGKPQTHISVNTDKASYKPKEKVTVSIKVTDKEGKPLEANVSIAVIDADAVSENSTDMVSYLELQSEVRGHIKNIKQYFDQSNQNRYEKLNLLLLTQGWRDFTWRRLVDSALRVAKSSRISGALPSDFKKAGIKSIPEVVAEAPSPINISKDTIALNKVVIKADSRIRLTDQYFKPFGKDDVLIVERKDYDHKNLRHYLLHYGPGAQTDSENNIVFGNYYPRLVVNGTVLPFTNEDMDKPIRDQFYSEYLNMPVSSFEKIVISRGIDFSIDRITKQSINGTAPPIRYVYVMFLTLNSAISRNQLIALQESAKAFYQSREFYAPDYETGNVTQDLRTTIHWEPNIITNEAGELQLSFYNSTLAHKMMVLVEGITENLGPISSKAEFEVKE